MKQQSSQLPWGVVASNRTLDQSAQPADRRSRGSSRIHWHSLSDGLLLGFLVCGPCLLAVEGLRHRVGRLWLLPAVIGLVGMVIAGAVAGRHRRRPAGALLQGLAVALPVSVVLVLADVLYRAIGTTGISHKTLLTWVAAVVGSVVLAGIGSLIGRSMYLHRWRQRGKL